MFSPKIILHSTDFSDCSNCALQIASDLATKYGSRIIVLHVVETLGSDNVTYGEVATQLEPEGYSQRLRDEIHNVKPIVSSDVVVEYLILEGSPAHAIEQAAQEHGCDLIVMGTHGHQGLRRLLMGSVAELVVRRASCAVLTVKLAAAHGS